MINWNDAPDGTERAFNDNWFRLNAGIVEFNSCQDWFKCTNQSTAMHMWNGAEKRPSLGDMHVSSNKYEREITDRYGKSSHVDVYDVLLAFDVTCPATQHAIKKLLCSGIRGHKYATKDLAEAKESITRAIELVG